MKYFYSYLKANLRHTAMIFLTIFVFSGIMLLNHVRVQEICYGILICFVIFCVFSVSGAAEYYKRLKEVQELKETALLQTELKTEAKDEIESAYKETIVSCMEEINRLKNEASIQKQEITDYYAMWVHQIKTPIAGLRLLLQEKEQEIDVREEMHELFLIEQYVEMALYYIRLDADSTDFVLGSVKLDDVLRQAIHKYARLFIGKKLSLDYKGVSFSVISDEKWLEFVVEQLLSNAIKYTSEGKISVFAEQKENVIILTIEDTGIGIHAEDLPRVCEKGYTGYNGRADKKSTGIGLYLCNRIIKKLGHKLKITSEEGKGTKASVYFYLEL